MPKRVQAPSRTGPAIIVALLTFVAAVLRYHGLFAGGLHADEALFATWARLVGTWQSPLLSNELVDKPPLLFYVQALFYPLMGSTEPWVSRLPNLAVSLMAVPLTARLVWNLFNDRLAMVVAAILVCFSPLLVQFSATSFTDPLLTALLLASLVLASARAEDGPQQAAVAGLLLGLAIATKHQAVLFVPLHLAIAWLSGYQKAQWRRWLVGLFVPVLGLILWQVARGGDSSLWGQQMASFGGLRLAWSWELWPRLEGWADVWGAFLGAPVLAFALLLFSPVFLALLIQHQDRRTAIDQALLLFFIFYMLLHWFLAVPVWDRYLLPLAPLAAMVIGRFVSRVLEFLQPELPGPAPAAAAGAAAVMFILMTPAGVAARDGEFDVGAQQRGPAIAGTVTEELQAAPYGTVLYDHWFSQQWRYYLMDSRVYVSWFPHAQVLVADLDAFHDGQGERYVVLPGDATALPVRRALREAGYRLEAVDSAPDMALYLIER